MTKREKLIEETITSNMQLEKQLDEARTQLMDLDPRFKQFIELEQRVKEESSRIWTVIRDQMNQHDIRKISGDWGSITLVEKIGGWTTELDKLPRRYVKKVANTEALTMDYNLTNIVPAGATPNYTKYLLKKIK